MSEAALWILGGLLGALGALCQTFTRICWRYTHLTAEEGSPTELAELSLEVSTMASTSVSESGGGNPSARWTAKGRRAFTTGLLLYIPATMANLASLALAPQSLASATAGLAGLFNLLFAPSILGEKWDRFDVCGVSLTVAGCLGVALSNSTEPADYSTFEEMLQLFTTVRFVRFCIAVVVYLGAAPIDARCHQDPRVLTPSRNTASQAQRQLMTIGRNR